jgi:hypothetical protein
MVENTFTEAELRDGISLKNKETREECEAWVAGDELFIGVDQHNGNDKAGMWLNPEQARRLRDYLNKQLK